MKAAFFLFFFFFSVLSLSAQRFAFEPGILDFHVEPGTTQTQAVRITNSSEKTIAFQAYINDWLRDSTGGHNYFRPDTLKRSCASWISLNKNFIEVPPNTTEEILVTMHGPINPGQFTKMKWAMLFIQTAEEKDSAAKKSKEVKTEIKELMRAGIHIYQTPSQVTNAAARVDYLISTEDTTNTFIFGVKNIGDVMLQCKSTLALTNIENGQEYKLDKIEFPMFPDGNRAIKFKSNNIPKGKYSALAILDYGEDNELQAIEKSVEIK